MVIIFNYVIDMKYFIFLIGILLILNIKWSSSQKIDGKHWLYCNHLDTCFMIMSNEFKEEIPEWIKEIIVIDEFLIKKQISYKSISDEFDLKGYRIYKGDNFTINTEDDYTEIFTLLVSRINKRSFSMLGEFVYHPKYGIIIAMGEYQKLILKKVIFRTKVNNEQIVKVDELIEKVLRHEIFIIKPPSVPDSLSY
jgi:hypothetical protein